MVKKIALLCFAFLLPILSLAYIMSGHLPAAAQNRPSTEETLIQAPALSFTKTVGTHPAICATNQTITLPIGGGEVTYCYEVMNTGDVSLTRHTLIDDQLGTILSNFPFNLTPGATVFLTQSAQITMTTVNTATWTGFNPGPVDEVSDSDTAVVIVTLPDPAIVLTKTAGTDPALCAANSTLSLPVGGGPVTYCYKVTNTGNITLSRHTLVDDQLGTILSDFNFNLSPGATVYLTQTALITSTTINLASWSASNLGPRDAVEATDTAVVFVGYIEFLPVILRE